MFASPMLETLAVVLLVGLALWIGHRAWLGSWPDAGRAVAIFSVSAVTAAVLSLVYHPEVTEESEVTNRPIEVPAEGHVTSRTCQACHPSEYESWHHSYHRTMTQVASPETVAGDFSNLRLDFKYAYLMSQRGDEFWVASNDPTWVEAGGNPGNGGFVERQIVLTTGSHHEQMYWFWTGESRKLALFPFAYRVQEKRWLPFTSILLTPQQLAPDVFGRWNGVCTRCHTTNSRPHITGPMDMDTEVSEWGIACESCHGPAAEHVHANRNPGRRYALHLGDDDDSTIVQPAKLDSRRSTFVCGSCHSIHGFPTAEEFIEFTHKGFTYRPGDDLDATRHVIVYQEEPDEVTQRVMKEDPYFLEDRFWPDGMILVGGREYNGTIKSPCFERGDLECISCHAMHKKDDDPRSWKEWADDQLGYGMDGNAACLQCHPTFAADLEAHTHHPAESPGSNCYNCHMPNTIYGLLKASRSHQISSPSVTETLEYGRPNACNLCHLDQTLAWTGSHLEQWWNSPQPKLTDIDHQLTSQALLELLSGHAGQRALLAWGLGWEPAREVSGSDWMPPFLAYLLEDPYGAVRDISYRTLLKFPGYEDLEYDPLGPPEQRHRARDVALAIWEKQRNRSPGPMASQVLLDSEGRLRAEKLAFLLRQRDDRRVNRGE